jgi:hypothetical protein
MSNVQYAYVVMFLLMEHKFSDIHLIDERWRTQITPTYFTFLGVVDSTHHFTRTITNDEMRRYLNRAFPKIPP